MIKLVQINSVLGPIGTDDLKFTLMHEHILTGPAGAFRDYPELSGINPMKRIINELIKAKKDGIDTIVDATTLDLGRNIAVLEEASRESGVNIIACTGWWLDFPRQFAGVSSDQLAEVFIREIEQGISGTNASLIGIAQATEGFRRDGIGTLSYA